MRMPDYEKAGWLADKIPAYGDYAKCAANLLRKQADQIVTITAALRMAKEALILVDEYKWPIHPKAREAIATITEALESGE